MRSAMLRKNLGLSTILLLESTRTHLLQPTATNELETREQELSGLSKETPSCFQRHVSVQYQGYELVVRGFRSSNPDWGKILLVSQCLDRVYERIQWILEADISR
jgi:hypothetical protein